MDILYEGIFYIGETLSSKYLTVYMILNALRLSLHICMYFGYATSDLANVKNFDSLSCNIPPQMKILNTVIP